VTAPSAPRDIIGSRAAIAVLSGPSFAQEVYEKQPTAVVAAAQDHDVAKRAQETFSSNHFRVYSHTDVVGVVDFRYWPPDRISVLR